MGTSRQSSVERATCPKDLTVYSGSLSCSLNRAPINFHGGGMEHILAAACYSLRRIAIGTERCR